MLRATLGLATAALLLISADAQAAACRNAAGKFVACPSTPAAAGQRCRGPSGAFVKCGTPGAKPVTAGKMAAKSKTTTVAAVSKPKAKVH